MKKTNILSLLLVLFGFALVSGCTPNTDTPEVPEETTYTVTYSSEYGTAPASITVTENTVLTEEQLPELSTEGKTFGGWFDGDTKAESGKYKVTKTVTLTAKWDVNTYTVTFNTNGGNSVESKTVTYGGKVEKPADPTKNETSTERYSFAYWYTSDNPNSAFDFDTEIKADITLYAKWNTTALYSITIASGTNGTVTADKISKITAGETITLTVTPNDGYELDTLSVKNGDTEIIVTNNQFTMPAGNVTVSATFKEIIREYKVEYHWWNSSTENGLIEGETEALDRKLELVNGLLISKPKSDEAWNLFFSEKLPEIYEYVDNNNNSIFYAICDGIRDIYKFVNCEILDNTIKLYYKWQGSSINALYLY